MRRSRLVVPAVVLVGLSLVAAAFATPRSHSVSGPTFAYAATKLLLTREADMSLQSAIELEAWTQAYLMRSADHAEFFKAQADKRPPAWTGR